MAGEKYLFPQRLVEGLIKSRPNRFIMMVELGGRLERCHCPATGRIGSFRFENIPCLLSKAGKDSGRKTTYTVEAISLDPPGAARKKWIGINLVEANRYVEFFLKRGKLGRMVKEGGRAERERKLGHSRIDFSIDDRTFIEVKTMVMNIPSERHPNYRPSTSKFTGFGRMIRHLGELGKSVRHGSHAVLLHCNLYDAKPFRPPADARGAEAIKRAARRAMKNGVEWWQVNLKVDAEGVGLLKYFRLRFET